MYHAKLADILSYSNLEHQDKMTEENIQKIASSVFLNLLRETPFKYRGVNKKIYLNFNREQSFFDHILSPFKRNFEVERESTDTYRVTMRFYGEIVTIQSPFKFRIEGEGEYRRLIATQA